MDPDVTSLAIRNFNRSMIELGKEAIERFGQEEREVSGITINVTKEVYKHVKDMVRVFKKEVADYVNNEKKDSDIVGQLNFQLFPLAKAKRGN